LRDSKIVDKFIREKKLKIESQSSSDIFISQYPQKDLTSFEIERSDTNEQIKNIISDNLAHLSDKELFVIKQRFYNGANFREIAVKFNHSHQRIHQVYLQSLQKIKLYLTNQNIDKTILV
jgi:DNA-directed RNA polymerase sigma subunit (sigma70/sigma32)